MGNILRIGICDDDSCIHVEVEKYINQYSKMNDITCVSRHFVSGKELLTFFKTDSLDILFLDIDMPEMDGIETAYQLNTQEAEYKIIMLTSKIERFKEAFKIGAFRFVTKPIQEEEVFEVICDVRNRLLGQQKFRVFRKGQEYTIFEKDIYYITMEKTSAIIYTKKYEFRSDESLLQWQKKLDERLFCRCHKAYIVNIGKIERIEKEVTLISGERILVSRRNKTALEKLFMEYDTKYR